MSFFLINDAMAADVSNAAGSPANGGLSTILMLVMVFVIFYFIIIRPQMKRNKDHQNLVNNLQKGDEIVTSGGILGRIVKIEDTIITIAISDDVEIKVQRNAIGTILPKGSLKTKE